METMMTATAHQHNPCERCDSDRHCGSGSRRFRCVACKRLVCIRCCQVGGWGLGHRWAECHDCESTRHAKKAVK
jgi:hypothetical protein